MSARVTLVAIAAAATLAVLAPAASAKVPVKFKTMAGYPSPGTPANLNKVGVLQIGARSARNILVLNPGTSASAAYFAPLAKTVVEKAKGWQVWAVERRENLLEDHSVLDQAKDGNGHGPGAVRLLPRMAHRSEHHEPLPVHRRRRRRLRARLGHARRDRGPAARGEAGAEGRPQGGRWAATRSAARSPTAYATWDFDGKPGAQGPRRSGLHRRRQQPDPDHPDQATQRSRRCRPPRPG